jgi:hypothetical protein
MVLAWVFGLSAALGWPRRAQAEEDSNAAARAQFEAQSLLTEGRYKEACNSLEQIERSQGGPFIEWSLANCFESAGHAARAWQLYRQIAEEPRSSAEDQRLATARATALEPRLAHLQVQPPHPAVDGLRVTVDGVALEPQRWGGDLRVDVGAHRVDVEAPGYRPWRRVVRLSAGPRPMLIAVPALDVGVGDVVTDTPLPGALDPIEMQAADVIDGPRRPNYTAAIIAGSIGVAGLTVGALAKWLSSSKSQGARKLCSQQPEGCPQSTKDDRDALKRYAHNARQAGDVALGVGAIGLITGGILFFIARGKDTEKDPVLEVTPSLGMDQLGVSVSGRF